MNALFLLFALLPSAWAGDLPNCKDQWSKGEGRYSQESYSEYYSRTKRDSCEKDWTILVYMAADNDLFPYALMDLYEMESPFESSDYAASTDKLDLIVQVDGTEKNDERRLHLFAQTQKYEVKKVSDFANKTLADVKSPVIETLKETRKADQKKRFQDFLSWGTEKYPAKQLMVIVWGHGQGWKAYPVQAPAKSRYLKKGDLPEFPEIESDRSFGGIAFRGDSGDRLSIPDLRESLQALADQRGRAVDVYASDSCLMQMFEVAHELAETARFIVGSTQIQNFLGLPYRRMMYEINSEKFLGEKKESRGSISADDEPYFIAKMIPVLMKQSLDPRRGLQGRADKHAQKFMTSSAITTAEAENFLVPALADLGSALEVYLNEDPLRAMDLQFVMQNVPAFEGGAQDLAVFFAFLRLQLREEDAKGNYTRGSEKVLKAVEKAESALQRSVVAYAYGESYAMDAHSRTLGFFPKALSIWLPVQAEEYQKRRKEFRQSRFYQDTGWERWLDLVFPKN